MPGDECAAWVFFKAAQMSQCVQPREPPHQNTSAVFKILHQSKHTPNVTGDINANEEGKHLASAVTPPHKVRVGYPPLVPNSNAMPVQLLGENGDGSTDWDSACQAGDHDSPGLLASPWPLQLLRI